MAPLCLKQPYSIKNNTTFKIKTLISILTTPRNNVRIQNLASRTKLMSEYFLVCLVKILVQ